MPDVAVGLVGVGAWGKLILRDLISLGCAVTVVVRDEGRRRHALESGAVVAVARIEDLPDDLQGIVVATPTATHAEGTEALLSRNVPLYGERPLTHDAPAATPIAERARHTVRVK